MKDPFMSRLTDLNIFGAGGLEAHLIKNLDPPNRMFGSKSWIQHF